jgi:hypothetical protein
VTLVACAALAAAMVATACGVEQSKLDSNAQVTVTGKVLAGAAGAPPSRSAPCAAVSASGTDAFKAPCALTSGDFGGTYTAGTNSTGVVIDLGQIRSLALVVVRGCSGQCPVAIGSDLSALQEVSTAAGEYWALAPARSARYVRVMGSNVSLLRQISAW